LALDALLAHRHELYVKYPVPADQVARALTLDETCEVKLRSLSVKILRLFRDGKGKPQWRYFEEQIRLGVPPAEQAAELDECARLYREAFPTAHDCPSVETPSTSTSTSTSTSAPTSAGVEVEDAGGSDEPPRPASSAGLPAVVVAGDLTVRLAKTLAVTRRLKTKAERDLEAALRRLSVALDRQDHALRQLDEARVRCDKAESKCDGLSFERDIANARRRAAEDRLSAIEQQVADTERALVQAEERATVHAGRDDAPSEVPGRQRDASAAGTATPVPTTAAGNNPTPPTDPPRPRPSEDTIAVSGGLEVLSDTIPLNLGDALRGNHLPATDWDDRHRLICLVLYVQLPAILSCAVIRAIHIHHASLTELVAALTPPALLLVAARAAPGGRRVRATAASLGLVCCAAVPVVLSDGATWAYFASFVAIGLIALYEDWAISLAAIGLLFIANITVDHSSWTLAAANVMFAFALASAQLAFWHYNESARARAEHAQDQLSQGQHSALVGLAETDQIRSDFVAVVSGEFQGPMTAIVEILTAIRNKPELATDLPLQDKIDSVVGDVARLSGLLENMATAATASELDENVNAITELTPQVETVVATLMSASPLGMSTVTIDMPDDLRVWMPLQAVQQLLVSLLDGVMANAWPGERIRLSAGRIGDEVTLRIRTPGPDLDPAPIRSLLEPLTPRENPPDRDLPGVGMGLYVVRRLLDAHGGQLRMDSSNGEILIEVRLRTEAPPPSTAPLPAPALPTLPPLAATTPR
jgi:signal transduction histidine kinase